jgi:hypothetical protein
MMVMKKRILILFLTIISLLIPKIAFAHIGLDQLKG